MEVIILSACIGLTLLFLMMAVTSNKGEKKVETHITQLRQQVSTQPKTVLREKALENSFYERALFPFAQKVFEKTQEMIPLTSKSFVTKKLIHGGYNKFHYPKVFFGIQLLCTGILFFMMLGLTGMFMKMPPINAILISGVFGAFGYGLPLLWLMQQAQRRQESIQKALPDFLDLLVICVEAGLGLDIAITKIANLETVKTSEHLKQELLRYCADMNFGKSRRDALLGMADRTGVEDLTAIVNALVQSYEMGSGVAHTLRVQSDSLRVKRMQKAEEKANKIPVKMVIPIYIFLFPSIFLAIFGPMGMIIIEAVFKIFQGMKNTQ